MCLVMIVKNEASIIRRMLDSVRTIINSACIVDTGSTDDTVEAMRTWFAEAGIKHHIGHEPFTNFGHNRTHSAKLAQATFPEADYLLFLDADFVLNVSPEFRKSLLKREKYTINQKSPTMTWSNIRIMSAKLPIVCVGVTHEYWDVEPGYVGMVRQYHINTLTITDIGDGGCKSDKYERDKRLLTEGLADDTIADVLRSRYMFYLARTYECMGELDMAIQAYTDRFNFIGASHEADTFYSAYSIGNCYQQLTDKAMVGCERSQLCADASSHLHNALHWYRIAHTRWPGRAESAYQVAKLCRIYHMHQESYEWAMKGKCISMPTGSQLFVEDWMYRYGFHYELSIVCHYLGKFNEGRDACEHVLSATGVAEHDRLQTEENSQYYL
jgi:glycosyltransferase involved in cell wall biosynthesis